MSTATRPAAELTKALDAYRSHGVVSREDIAAVELLVEMARRDGAAEPSLLAWLGMCLAMRTVRDGHTCVDFSRIREWSAGLDRHDLGNLQWPTTIAAWVDEFLHAERLVGPPGSRRPFILDGHRLYLARSHAEEAAIAATMLTRAKQGRLRILLGGPGTGKTTKIARDLVSHFTSLPVEAARPRLALAAPTGKAAARMSEVLRARCTDAGATPEVIAVITAEPARTVHKLLGYNPSHGNRTTYHAGHPLPYDIVIVDEASMLSSALMHQLLSAIHPDAELRLVGDPDQLASVDAGTVLGDLALAAAAGSPASPLQASIETLTTIHRAESPDIIDLAAAIRESDACRAFEVLGSGSEAVAWVDPAHRGPLEALLATATEHARRLRAAAMSRQPMDVLTTKGELQVLCAHRDGSMGVTGWNTRIERQLVIPPGELWYAGRPVMVTRNSRALGLANGDVGVTVPAGGRMEALFGLPNELTRVPATRLEHVATVHALTIHKSQGSEYDHAIVVLPEQPSRIATRELFYTGVTRARRKVTVVAPREVIEVAIGTPIRRATGLAERLAEAP
jgi:exodeoxyribonuclease V alpha subunit